MRRAAIRSAATLTTMLAVVAVTPLAAAHLMRHVDSDDVGHALDAREVDARPIPMGEYRGLAFTVRTHERFRKSDLNHAVRPTKDIRWNVRTLHSNETDRAPDEGWYEH